jgi:hypothetical protein
MKMFYHQSLIILKCSTIVVIKRDRTEINGGSLDDAHLVTFWYANEVIVTRDRIHLEPANNKVLVIIMTSCIH